MPDVTTLPPASQPHPSLPTDTTLDILYLARTAALPELKEDLQTHSQTHNATPAQILQAARDPHTGNTAAHYAAANGHDPILRYVQELEADERLAVDGTASDSEATPRSLFSSTNETGSTPLHYAAVNGQLKAVEVLLAHPGWAEDKGRRRGYVEMRNQAGRTARDEADLQGAGREEWLKVVGLLEKHEGEGEDEEEAEAAGDAVEGEVVDAAVDEDVEKAREGVGGVSMG